MVYAAALLALAPAGAEQLVFDDALKIALERSPSIEQARHNLEISRRNLEAQRATLKPRLSLNVTPYEFSKNRIFSGLTSQYNTEEQTHLGATFAVQQPLERTDGTLSLVQSLDWRRSSSTFAGGDVRKTYNNQLFLRYSQPLHTYNRTKLNLRQLELSLKNAQLQYALQRLQIESQITQLFLDLYLKQRNVEIIREELKNATERYEIIESKVRGGITAREQLLQADLTRANARGGLEDAQLQYANSLDDFKLLLGLSLDMELTIAADVRKQLVEVNLQQAIRRGLANRMELRQRDIDIENAMQQLITTDAENEFKGSVDLTFGLIGIDEQLGHIYDEPTRNQQVTVTFNVPLFDWGEKRHRMAAARESVARSKLSAAEERKSITAEIRQAHRNLQSQKTRIEIAEKNVSNARQTYEINLERYRNGDLSSKDIADYQNQLSREQINQIGVLINYRLALLNLKICTLYDFVRGAPVQALGADQETDQ